MPQAITFGSANSRQARDREVVGSARSQSFKIVGTDADGEQRARVEAVMASQTPVRRQCQPWECLLGPNGEEISVYDEVLVCTPEAVRTTYLDSGMSFCDTHNRFSVMQTFGATLPGKDGYRFEGAELIGVIELNDIADACEVTDAIRTGSLKYVSISYSIYRAEWDMSGSVPLLRVTDWEPEEVSICAVPADVTAKVRSRFSAHRRAARQKTESIMPPTATPSATPAPAADPTATTPLAAARSEPAAVTVIPADNSEFVAMLDLVRRMSGGAQSVLDAVEAARSLGSSIDEIRAVARRSNLERSLAAPATTSALPIAAEPPAAPGKRSVVTEFDAYAILQRRKEMRGARRSA